MLLLEVDTLKNSTCFLMMLLDNVLKFLPLFYVVASYHRFTNIAHSLYPAFLCVSSRVVAHFIMLLLHFAALVLLPIVYVI
jgi:hypothetical protein